MQPYPILQNAWLKSQSNQLWNQAVKWGGGGGVSICRPRGKQEVKNFLVTYSPDSLCEFPVTAETTHNKSYKSSNLKQEQHIIHSSRRDQASEMGLTRLKPRYCRTVFLLEAPGRRCPALHSVQGLLPAPWLVPLPETASLPWVHLQVCSDFAPPASFGVTQVHLEKSGQISPTQDS